MKRSSLAIALLAAVLFSACNNGSKPPGSSKSPTASVSSSVPSAIPTETEEERHERERKSLGYSPENPPPAGFAPASKESPQPGHLTLEVKFNPTCVERGKSTKLTARTNHPKTRVSFVTPLADEKGHAIENDGRTDEKGLWTWEFMVPVNSAPHTYEMLGAAQDDEGAGEAHNVIGNWFFVVADPGQCT